MLVLSLALAVLCLGALGSAAPAKAMTGGATLTWTQAPPALVSTGTITVSFSADDPDNLVAGYVCQFLYQNGVPVESVPCLPDTPITLHIPLPYANGLSSGIYSFSVYGMVDLNGPMVSGNFVDALQASWSATTAGLRFTSQPSLTTTSTSAIFAWDGYSGLDYTCSLDYAAFVACDSGTGETLSGLSVGVHSMRVQAIYGSSSSSTYWNWAVTVRPGLIVAPSISGTLQVGETLTADPGAWSGDPAPTFSYAWSYYDGTDQFDIGTDSPALVIPAEALGSGIRVGVRGTNSAGSDKGGSPWTELVAAAAVVVPPVVVALPVVVAPPVATPPVVVTPAPIEAPIVALPVVGLKPEPMFAPAQVVLEKVNGRLTVRTGAWSGDGTIVVIWSKTDKNGRHAVRLWYAGYARSYTLRRGQHANRIMVTVHVYNQFGVTVVHRVGHYVGFARAARTLALDRPPESCLERSGGERAMRQVKMAAQGSCSV